MAETPDPFARHPELRGLIAAPETSFWRGFDPAALEAELAARGVPSGWRGITASSASSTRSAVAAPPSAPG